jgi:hypothetical protein
LLLSTQSYTQELNSTANTRRRNNFLFFNSKGEECNPRLSGRPKAEKNTFHLLLYFFLLLLVCAFACLFGATTKMNKGLLLDTSTATQKKKKLKQTK